ncbi:MULTISPECIES: FAD-dependent oxidoreductase [unclassified Rhodococcus (in: high G+C Gram-positive bacteria)]|uniref:ferredoxin--NADP(+) reductase n=8 Tax=Mycobacteriales TaxID=85007 RepID=Q8GPH8_RHORH|nr:FAD-dependent oxidoreductase [Rhodococcus sp. T9N]AAN27918.1 adrenodoxin reductase-like [Rhodococcus rhodochrous]KAF0966991.1 putative ferredoxin/ferredoxin--NADP reductase [Gordonia sp. YY1]NCL78538.1 putative ferredoxin/ferredoxin--NADP reductase [Rhodococcus sp. YH1]ART90643.1 flavodoxin reductase (XplB) [Rhodococcus rhodochrous]NCL78559.1 putative ferredoxin/ferredoxin--NADP reductase [Rhodococcus sp. YH1]
MDIMSEVDVAPRVAVVGAGPSGCFTAQQLRKQWPEVEVTVFDRLPTPFGLLRYGVAPDHQGTKNVIRQLSRVFDDRTRFVGNIELGRNLSIEDLRAAFDVVVLATGLSGDRRLGIPGDDLPGIVGSGRFTRCVNDHPAAGDLPTVGRRVVLVGGGNVAMDIIRLLSKQPDEFTGSDLHPDTLGRLRSEGPRRIDVVVRSTPTDAKFDPVMMRELAHLASTEFRLADAGVLATAESSDPRSAALAHVVERESPAAPATTVVFHFGSTPVEVIGTDRAEAVKVRTGVHTTTLACDTVITAIGFESAVNDDLDLTLYRDADPGEDFLAPGLYRTGWLHSSTGALPEMRARARALAARIRRDHAGHHPARPGLVAIPYEVIDRTVDFDGWMRIDEAEVASASPGRIRQKVREVDAMLALARTVPAESVC